MQATLKRAILLVILALALLLSLAGWTARMMTMPAAPYHMGVQSSRIIADGPNYYCPPPPRGC